MPESLPGVLLDQTPEILWKSVDSPDWFTVIPEDGDPTPYAEWVQHRASNEGVRTRVFLDYVVPQGSPFEIGIDMPLDCEIQVSIRDRQVEYIHQASVKAHTLQRILRFSKGKTTWTLSPSFGATSSGDEPSTISNAELTSAQKRLTSTPQEFRKDVETLITAFPILLDSIGTVNLVVDISASMSPVLKSSMMEQIARLTWSLGYAAGNVFKTCTLVGQRVEQRQMDTDPENWTLALQQDLGGMPTGTPYLMEKTLSSVPSGTFTLCITDAEVFTIDQIGTNDQGGFTAVMVWDPSADPEDPKWKQLPHASVVPFGDLEPLISYLTRRNR